MKFFLLKIINAFVISIVVTVCSQNAYGQSCSTICNGNFDDIIVATSTNIAYPDTSQMPCWQTTATNGNFEVWYTGFQGVPAYSGLQFVELNAQSKSDLYQDFQSQPGSLIHVSFAHRGRWGIDTMSVWVGPTGGPQVKLGTFADDSTAWGFYTLSYVLPNAGNNYQVWFKSVYGAGGNPTVGNFLDDVNVTTSCVEIKDTCYNDLTTLSINDSAGFFAFQWNFGDPASGPLNMAFNAAVSHVFTSPGTFPVEVVRAFPTPPFSDTLHYDVTIHPLPVVNIGNDTTVCSGQTLILQCANVGTYLWQNGSTNFYINVNTTGTYSVAVTTLFGCTGNDSIDITFQPCTIAIANLASSDTNFCEKQCIDFFDLSQNGPTSWLWTFSGASPSTSTDQNPTGICYNSYGSFGVQLIACNIFGCDTASFPNFITEFASPASPVLSQSGDTLICSVTNVTYSWFNVNNPTTVLGTNYYYLPSVAGQYYVVINDTNGCDVASSIFNSAVSMHEWMSDNVQLTINTAENSIDVLVKDRTTQLISIKLYDCMGREAVNYFNSAKSAEARIALPYNVGTYILKIETTKSTYHRKLVVSGR